MTRRLTGATAAVLPLSGCGAAATRHHATRPAQGALQQPSGRHSDRLTPLPLREPPVALLAAHESHPA